MRKLLIFISEIDRELKYLAKDNKKKKKIDFSKMELLLSGL